MFLRYQNAGVQWNSLRMTSHVARVACWTRCSLLEQTFQMRSFTSSAGHVAFKVTFLSSCVTAINCHAAVSEDPAIKFSQQHLSCMAGGSCLFVLHQTTFLVIHVSPMDTLGFSTTNHKLLVTFSWKTVIPTPACILPSHQVKSASMPGKGASSAGSKRTASSTGK